MKKVVLGFLLGLLTVAFCGYLYFALGRAPVATADPPMPFEKALARMALRARLREPMKRKAPIAADETNFAAGAKVYKDNCAGCHGLPNQPVGNVARGMFPYPPQLFHGEEMVTDDPAGETFWKASNGIRLTGMPAFRDSLNETQLWQVALLLANLDKLPPTAQDLLR